MDRRRGRPRPRLGRREPGDLFCREMRLSFRQRILLILIGLGALPTALAILGWVFTIRSASFAHGAHTAMAEVGASGRALLRAMDTTHLSAAERRALAAHADRLNAELARTQQIETYRRYYS